MAKRSFKVAAFTPVAVADGANMTNQGFMGVQGGSATQFVDLVEIFMGGQAGVSSPCIMLLSRDSVVGATLTALTTGESDAPLHPSTAALAAPVKTFTQSTTKPQRDATNGLLNLSFNAFGGTVRWYVGYQEEISLLGNTQPLGELSLSHFTGGTPGAIGAHIIFEPK